MPSTYAHYIFGQQIRGRLSGYERKVIDKYPELFNIGLHGPGYFFLLQTTLQEQGQSVGKPYA